MKVRTTILVLGALLLAACGGEAEQAAPVASGAAKPATTASTAAKVASSAPNATATAAVAADDDVPTEADFEEEAAAITDESSDAELDALAKEIASDG
jgi:hypothetical protein